ncbi:MAG: glycerophosphodiester phosphodiesterase family protein [Candidatus Omnitrophota bacterium]|nr:glycerophosphodiester phosphodiesterase family protein [Candidatus Omnitrophota bacterium]
MVSDPSPLVIAHRGASSCLPENTIAAFRKAVDLRADMLEFDVWFSKDAVPVICHDARLERTTNGMGFISDHTFETLSTFDAGYHFQSGGEFPCRGLDMCIPSLEEVFKCCPRTRYAIEIKQKSPALVHAVMMLVEKYGVEEQSIVGSEHDVVFECLREQHPRVRRFLSRKRVCLELFRYRTKRAARLNALSVASIPVQYMGMRLDTTDWIKYLHLQSIPVFFWGVENAEIMRRVWENGADGICANDIELLNRVLNRNPGTDPTIA